MSIEAAAAASAFGNCREKHEPWQRLQMVLAGLHMRTRAMKTELSGTREDNGARLSANAATARLTCCLASRFKVSCSGWSSGQPAGSSTR